MQREPQGNKIVLAFIMFLITAIMIGSVVERKNTDIKINKAVHGAVNDMIYDCNENIKEIKRDVSEINYNLAKINLNFDIMTAETTETTTENQHKIKFLQKCELPTISTNVKLFTDYRAYNLWYTPHYRLQQVAWTDNYGLRRFNNDYIVALGSYYSVEIGDRFEITLTNGNIFTVIFGDGKADIDCDSKCMYTPCLDYNGNQVANLLEFIIDETKLPKDVYEYGSIDKLEEFSGDIVKMVYLGRDQSQDWDTYETIE